VASGCQHLDQTNQLWPQVLPKATITYASTGNFYSPILSL